MQPLDASYLANNVDRCHLTTLGRQETVIHSTYIARVLE